MSFTATLLSIEDLGIILGHAGNTYQQWRLNFDGDRSVRTGNEMFYLRAKNLIGRSVYVAQGGKEGIVGRVCAAEDK